MKRIKKMIFILLLMALLPACGESSRKAEEILLPGESEETDADSKPEEEAQRGTEEASRIYVQVCGAVEHPGVYELPEGSRVFHALALAGGVTQEADSASLNQAECVTDGQMIQVLTAEETAAQGEKRAEAQAEDDGKVNLNTAAKEELMTLAGIGEAKAKSILSWREEHGSFAQIEDLMKIEGIKEGVFSKIKDSVKVQ
ncbi:hypothetical protein D3Z36_10650 [Lachnospiraceae bacterium]|nr:hypothetical protein [Lachnospiraceae bacterium]